MVYKLYYFNIKALAEPIRMLLTYGDIEFEDNRLDDKQWAMQKSSMPMGQMPVLEIDGKKIHQSLSICRLLAKKFGLDGKTDFENFEIDSIAETVNDLRHKIATTYYETDAANKERKYKILNDEIIPFYLNKLDEIAKANDGHLALKRMTWADVWFTGLLEYMNFTAKQDLTAHHPNLKRVFDNTAAVPGIKKWFDIRPKNDDMIKSLK